MKMIEQGEINKNSLDIDLKSMIYKNKDDPNLLRKYKGNFGKSDKVNRVRKGKVGSYCEELGRVDKLYVDASKRNFLHLPLSLKIRGVEY